MPVLGGTKVAEGGLERNRGRKVRETGTVGIAVSGRGRCTAATPSPPPCCVGHPLSGAYHTLLGNGGGNGWYCDVRWFVSSRRGSSKGPDGWKKDARDFECWLVPV